MKTTSRKRLLVSSVAMLLVAMLALGTATYAWFTSNTTAKASGINVQTIKASELVISSKTSAYDTTVNYGISGKILLPASSATGTAWYTANAEEKTNFAKPSDVNFASVGSTDNYVFMDELNILNQGEATVEDVTITLTWPKDGDSSYLRVALVPSDAKNSETLTGTFADCVYDNAGVEYDAVNSETDTTKITPKTERVIEVSSLAKGESAHYNLFVWFEGQDVDCYDGKAGAIIPDISMSVSGNTVSQLG